MEISTAALDLKRISLVFSWFQSQMIFFQVFDGQDKLVGTSERLLYKFIEKSMLKFDCLSTCLTLRMEIRTAVLDLKKILLVFSWFRSQMNFAMFSSNFFFKHCKNWSILCCWIQPEITFFSLRKIL